MPRASMDAFRALVDSLSANGESTKRLSKRDVNSFLSSVPPEEKQCAELRELVLHTLLQAPITDSAADLLQSFLQDTASNICLETVMQSVHATCALYMDTSIFASDTPDVLEEVDLSTLRRVASAPAKDVESALCSLLGLPLSFEDVFETEQWIQRGHLHECIEWPDSGRPLPFEPLLDVLLDAFVQAFPVAGREDFVTLRNEPLTWNGPHLIRGWASQYTFIEQLLEAEETQQLKLQTLLRMGLQLGMEQGRRAAMSGRVAQLFDMLIRESKHLLADEKFDDAIELLDQACHLLPQLDFDAPIQPLRSDGLHWLWPEHNLPTSILALRQPLYQLFSLFLHGEQQILTQDIEWRGPLLPGLFSLPIPDRLTVEALESTSKRGMDLLSVLLSIVLSIGMMQGKRAFTFMVAMPVKYVLETALSLAREQHGKAAAKIVEAIELFWLGQRSD